MFAKLGTISSRWHFLSDSEPNNMSLALDAFPFFFSVYCGCVFCLSQGGRCWQDEDSFSNIYALSVKADVLALQSYSHTPTHALRQFCVWGVCPSFCCPSFVIRWKQIGQTIYFGKVFTYLKSKDFFSGFALTFIDGVWQFPGWIWVYFFNDLWLLCNLYTSTILQMEQRKISIATLSFLSLQRPFPPSTRL